MAFLKSKPTRLYRIFCNIVQKKGCASFGLNIVSKYLPFDFRGSPWVRVLVQGFYREPFVLSPRVFILMSVNAIVGDNLVCFGCGFDR